VAKSGRGAARRDAEIAAPIMGRGAMRKMHSFAVAPHCCSVIACLGFPHRAFAAKFFCVAAFSSFRIARERH